VKKIKLPGPLLEALVCKTIHSWAVSSTIDELTIQDIQTSLQPTLQQIGADDHRTYSKIAGIFNRLSTLNQFPQQPVWCHVKPLISGQVMAIHRSGLN
jgi:hypothetical protein